MKTKKENIVVIAQTNQSTFNRYFLLALFLLAFGLRLINIEQMRINNPFFEHPILDSKLYYDQAVAIARGDWLGDKVFFMGPLYSYLIALIFVVFGSNIHILLLFQALLGSFSCILIYLIAQKAFSNRTAVIAAMLAAFYSMFIFYDSQILMESVVLFLSLLFVYLMLMFDERPSLTKIFLAGIFLGLAITARPNILVIIPLVMIGLFMKRSKFSLLIDQSKTHSRNVWYFVLVFLLGTGLMVSLTTIRNWAVGRDLVAVTSSGGINFYIGNNSEATGTYMDPLGMGRAPDLLEENSAKKAGEMVGRELKSSEVSSYWFHEGMRFIVTNPAAYLKLLLTKLFLLFNQYEIPVNCSSYFLKQFSGVLRLPLITFGIIAPLALVGMFLAFKVWRRTFLLYAMIISYVIFMLLFFVLSRYRIPMAAIMIVFAGYAVNWVIEKAIKREYRPLVPILIIIAGFSIFANWKTKEGDFSNEYYNLGMIYNERGKFEKAVDAFNKALNMSPWYLPVYPNLGLAYDNLGLYDQAIEVYQTGIKLDPKLIRAYHYLGNAYLKKGEYGEAVRVYRQVIEINPDNAEAYYNLGIAYDRSGLTGEAITAYQTAVKIKPDLTFAYNNLGLIRARQGKLSEAIKEWEKILEIEPGNEGAQQNIMRARSMLDRR